MDSVKVINTKDTVKVVKPATRKVEVVRVGVAIGGNAGGGTTETISWSQITGKPATFSPAVHNHDDRYYTESEVDTKLSTKADSSTVTALASTVSSKETPSGAQAKADAALSAAETYTDNAVDAIAIPIVLGPTDPVPAGTPAGTIIVRTT